jgi:nucleoside-diphosphate-sugar epimerase
MAARLEDDGYVVDRVDIDDDHSPQDCRGWFDEHVGRWCPRYNLVVHCAAIVGGRANIDGNPLAIATNLSLDQALFDWAVRTEPDHVVYFSSSAAYPTWRQRARTNGRRLAEHHIDLDDPQLPDSMYGWCKLTGERLARLYADTGHRVHVFRPFSGYGETQSLDYPFPSFIKRARDRVDPFEVWGDGTQTRDWIHVDDIVGAVLTAVRFDDPGPINLGWGEPVSMGELVMQICEQAGHTPTVRLRPDMPTGVHYRVADAARMLSFYAPTVTLEEGIARALAAAPAAV